MNLEAFLIVGLVTLFLGALLYVPARVWARKVARDDPHSYSRLGLTRLGWILTLITVLALIGGLLMDLIAPNTTLGKLVNTSSGRFVYLLSVFLNSKGIKLFKERVPPPSKDDC
jgi:hypothetical protein